MTLLYQTEQIRQLENWVYESHSCTPFDLMRLAGQAVFDDIQARFPDVGRLLVYCGKGNNGGDGLVVAALAVQAGMTVTVRCSGEEAELSETAQQALGLAKQAGLTLHPITDTVEDVDLIVDALLGIGLRDALSDSLAPLVSAINVSDIPVVSIDVPSGLDSDTGDVKGVAVKADVTVTMIGYKQGLFTAKAAAHCGDVILAKLNIPNKLFDQVKPTARLLDWNEIKPLIPKRDRHLHKGDCGHVLVIGGDYGMGGAVRMAAEAAMRAGAGLVTVATRPEHLNVVVGARPEIMCSEVATAADLEPLLKRANVVVIGPGLGKSDWARDLLDCVMSSYHKMVLDADALNLLSQAPQQADDWVLTPHPGEASRLLDCLPADIQEDRFLALRELVLRYRGVVALKGSGTLIGTPEKIPAICTAGNPGMASGGMGDILSGIIGGLIAQGLRCYEAASAGILIHAMAGDRASKQGGERGLLATDLLHHIRLLVNPDDFDLKD